ncbi:bifunctional glycosyltransferase/CDP-glycerol:glycerophosphate glycerophosphotransferase [Rothia sp. CCM 9419]|uniref:bifunctional glycosyltransferase/CDP-glycerol:glycerophosphate glycerophosphotransferase n=1 Tax=Rothia sp. CCM 9419 TaxID=3402662 RepID=UPI003AE5830F
MSNPLFDVIIPASHAHETLSRAVDSALASDLVGQVLIVVDGGEQTAQVACRLGVEQNRVQVLYTGEDYSPACRGVSVARNIGLEHARSEWVTFLDADDAYDSNYFEAIKDFLDYSSHPPSIIHTRPLRVLNQQVEDTHPLRYRFASGDCLVSLEDDPHMIGLSAVCAVFPLQGLRDYSMQFNPELRFSEDADFIVRYLLQAQGLVGFSSHARYLYSVGSSGSLSTRAWSMPEKYHLPFIHAYYQWIKQCSGQLPIWLQNVLIYELSWYIQADREVFHPSLELTSTVRQSCAKHIRQVARYLSAQTIENYALTPLSLDRRMMLLACSESVRTDNILNGYVIRYQQRPWQKSRKYTYFFVGSLRQEEFLTSDGFRLFSEHSTWVSHTLYDTEFARERILWFSDLVSQALVHHEVYEVSPYRGLPQLPRLAQKQEAAPAVIDAKTDSQKVSLRRTLYKLRQKFWHLRKSITHQGSVLEDTAQIPLWLYMDRAHRAGDNAEVFYQYAQHHAPQVQHVFVLSYSSPDWARLEELGYHLVAVESEEYVRYVRQAQFLFLSDISDGQVVSAIQKLGQHQCLVFLQHGVIRHQIWRWLNPRRIDLMVTSTIEENELLLAEGSHYTISAPEVIASGLPRFDRLNHLIQQQTHRNIVLISPTWDSSLCAHGSGQDLQDWVNHWTADWLPQKFYDERGVELHPVFFVHPNMESAINKYHIDFPVETCYGHQFHEFLARSCAVITDRSSIAEDSWFAGVPVIRVLEPTEAALPHRRLKNVPQEQGPVVDGLREVPRLLLSIHQLYRGPHNNLERHSCKVLLRTILNNYAQFSIPS